MTETVDLDGVPTWYAEHGAGDPLVYLHGGFSDASELEPVRERYAERFRVLTPERRGHGHTPDAPGPYSYEGFADDTIAFLEAVVDGPADLVGFSDGATTALLVALQRPELVRRLVLISGQFHVDGLVEGMFGDDPAADAQAMRHTPLAARYAEVSPDGAAHFVVAAEKVIRMALTSPTLSAEDLAKVGARTLLVYSDDDVVTLEHAIAFLRGLPDGELAIVPGTSHVSIMEKPDLVADLALAFLTQEPVALRAPMRRRPAD